MLYMYFDLSAGSALVSLGASGVTPSINHRRRYGYATAARVE